MTSVDRDRPVATATPEPRRRYDGATILSLWLIFLFGIPQQWVLPGGGAVARPAVFVGLFAAFLYGLGRFNAATSPNGRVPVAPGLYAYFTIILLSVGLSNNRDLAGVEVTGGYREIIFTFSMLGVALTMASINDRARFELVLRRVVLGGGFVALIAIIQFYIGFDLLLQFEYPGLVLNGDELARSRIRNGFNRATGTAAHAIELGVIMAMMLPLALHYALHEANRSRAIRYWASAAAMAAVLPTTLSRSAVIATVIALGSLAVVWSRRQVVRAAAAGTVAAILITGVRPTLLRSVLNLFRRFEADGSVEARTDDYELTFNFIAERPWFGRGAGTWGADTYLLLDNQMLLSLLEIGWIGVIVLIAMFAIALLFAREIRFSAPDDPTRHLGQVMFGSLLAGFLPFFFVDAIYYQIYMGLCFLLIGAIGGLYRMMDSQQAPPDMQEMARGRSVLGRRFQSDGRPRWWTIAVARERRSQLRHGSDDQDDPASGS